MEKANIVSLSAQIDDRSAMISEFNKIQSIAQV